jgi:hypothetical protein
VKVFNYSLCAGLAISFGLYAQQEKNPAFQIKNNSKFPIAIKLIQQDRVLKIKGEDLVEIEPHATWELSSLDISKPTMMELNYCKSKDNCPALEKKTVTVSLGQKKEIRSEKSLPFSLMATFEPNKTIYIKWNGKTIKPQTGRRGKKKTAEGYSLENNVTTDDITIEYYS